MNARTGCQQHLRATHYVKKAAKCLSLAAFKQGKWWSWGLLNHYPKYLIVIVFKNQTCDLFPHLFPRFALATPVFVPPSRHQNT